MSIMADLDIITLRRREVLKVIAEAREALAAGEQELHDLDTTGRTLARLTGADWPPAGEEPAAAPPPPVTRRPVMREAKDPSIADMIRALVAQVAPHLDGIAPKDITRMIQEQYHKTVRGEYVSTSMWRLADKGELKKVGDGLYTAPD